MVKELLKSEKASWPCKEASDSSTLINYIASFTDDFSATHIVDVR